MRVLFATTGNDGHFGPLLPFARACAAAGHEVRVAAPESYAEAVRRAGFAHEPFGDAPPELIGPVMASLPGLPFEEADNTVIREVFARIDAQAGLPAVTETVARWRPDVVLRESAELASLAAAERFGVPHAHVCIGMHEVATAFAIGVAEPLEELGGLAGLADGQATAALAAETVFSLVPETLDRAAGEFPPEAAAYLRFHEPTSATGADLPVWGDPGLPLVYVTFGSVTGSLGHFDSVFRDALDGLAGLDARVLMTVGRRIDPAGLAPWPANARVEQWLPQGDVLANAAVMIGHGGFGTTLGALVAGVPQVVVPIFTSDQVVNGAHVAAAGAGIAVPIGPGSVARACAEVRDLLDEPSYAERARAVAAEFAALPHPSAAVPLITRLVG
jgi:UDP:flavonoid glycosyltransferase YjiC (YdhE family)